MKLAKFHYDIKKNSYKYKLNEKKGTIIIYEFTYFRKYK